MYAWAGGFSRTVAVTNREGSHDDDEGMPLPLVMLKVVTVNKSPALRAVVG
jgi:hypothetical protein